MNIASKRLITAAMAQLAIVWTVTGAAAQNVRPNILWISAEDISPHLGCYGDRHAKTPHLNQLASEGVRYTHAFTTAGVCAPCRSGIITGMYQTTIGTHHMRCQAQLPESIKPFPWYLRQSGYFCSNNAKEDYQFQTPPGTWDISSRKAHWRSRARSDQPFFAVFNFTGCHESGIAQDAKYRSVTSSLSDDQRQVAESLTTFPPYYPNSADAREDWKRNYELITAMDLWAGQLIDQLREDGLDENTIIMFWSDHGVGLPRPKRWLYDSGTHIPLIVRIPQPYRRTGQGTPNSVNDQLVSSIDLGPTVLNLAGIGLPTHMQGQPFLGQKLTPPREYVFGARDRMDERYDIIRMVRDQRFKYLRNYEPLKPYYQYINTPEKGRTMQALREQHRNRLLPSTAEQFFASTKPVEELYDTQSDPHEIHNLADDAKFAPTLQRLRSVHLDWVRRTKDLGLIPEPLLAERERLVGSRYDILRQSGGDRLAQRVAAAAVAAAQGKDALPAMLAALQDEDAAVRYWGITGLGNRGKDAIADEKTMMALLRDESAAVRIATARALCMLGKPELGLPILTHELQHGGQWERLQSAIVLDEIDEQARPVIASLRSALEPQSDLFAGGKYTVRVINQALNELEGTERVVR